MSTPTATTTARCSPGRPPDAVEDAVAGRGPGHVSPRRPAPSRRRPPPDRRPRRGALGHPVGRRRGAARHDGPIEPAVDGPGPLRPVGRDGSSACPASSTDPSGPCPTVRRGAWRDPGPRHAGRRALTRAPAPPPSGPGRLLVAYNLWLADAGPGRGPTDRRRAAGPASCAPWVSPVGDAVQVSCNLIDPWRSAPGLPSMPSPVGPPWPGPNWSGCSPGPSWTPIPPTGGRNSTSTRQQRSRPAWNRRASMGEGSLHGC